MDTFDKISTFGFVNKAGGIPVWYLVVVLLGGAVIYAANGCEVEIRDLMRFCLYAGSVCYSIGAIAIARGLFYHCSNNFSTIAWPLLSIMLAQVTSYDILNYLITDGVYSRFYTWINTCFYVLEIIVWFIAGISLLQNFKTGKLRILGIAMMAFLAWKIFFAVIVFMGESASFAVGTSCLSIILLGDVLMTLIFLWIMSGTYRKS